MPKDFTWGPVRGQEHRAGTALLPLPPLKYFIGHTFLVEFNPYISQKRPQRGGQRGRKKFLGLPAGGDERVKAKTSVQ